MNQPMRITYRGFEATEWLNDLIEAQAEKLERFWDPIVACRVGVEGPPQHSRHGGPVRVSEVEAEQKEMLKVVRRLSDEGQIVLSGGGDDDFL